MPLPLPLLLSLSSRFPSPRGFIPASFKESVSKGLEYAFEDSCIARVAGRLGLSELQAEFEQRAGLWREYLDPETGLMRPRVAAARRGDGRGAAGAHSRVFKTVFRTEDQAEASMDDVLGLEPSHNKSGGGRFDPRVAGGKDFTEADAWQYSFFVPHDVPGLMAAMGGAAWLRGGVGARVA